MPCKIGGWPQFAAFLQVILQFGDLQAVNYNAFNEITTFGLNTEPLFLSKD
jgi:hypothetical protein